MPHKITLTGHPTSELRTSTVGKDVYAFDMREKGSQGAPKGLPKSEGIEYTVFLNKKQWSKLQIDPQDIRKHKLLVQGEPTLNIPMDECPGEMGVISFQLQVIKPKEEETQKEEKEEAPMEKTKEGIQLIPIDDIVISAEFQQTSPRPGKLLTEMEHIEKTGTIDKPIVIEKETNVLTDGYVSYLAAKEKKLEKVPVKC